MFYDFSMFTPSPLLPSSPVLPLSRLALWQGQRQNYAHFQIHLNTRNCCCCSGAWHAFKICSLQNVCPHRDRDGDGDRQRERERGRETGKQPFWVPALPTNFWHFISKFIFCTANMATLGLQPCPHPLPFRHCLEKLFPALNCLPLCTTSPCNPHPPLTPSSFHPLPLSECALICRN